MRLIRVFVHNADSSSTRDKPHAVRAAQLHPVPDSHRGGGGRVRLVRRAPARAAESCSGVAGFAARCAPVSPGWRV